MKSKTKRIAFIGILAITGGMSIMAVPAPVAENSVPERYNYKYAMELNIEEGVIPITSQLSKDGNSLYFTGQNQHGKRGIYQLSRKGSKGLFGQMNQLNGKFTEKDVIMASVTADEKTVVFVSSTSGFQKGNDLFLAEKDSSGAFTKIRNAEEINDANTADNYPWISADGTRVYFTKQRGSNIEFYVAERSCKSNEFQSLKPVGFQLPLGGYNGSCSLTNNELEIFALSGNKIYHAKRNSLKEPFGMPEQILEAPENIPINSITISNDAKELYVVISEGFGKSRIVRFDNKPSVDLKNSLSNGK